MNNLSELNQKQENIKNETFKKRKSKKSKMNFFKYLATQHNERCNKDTKHKQVVMQIHKSATFTIDSIEYLKIT